MLLIASRLQVLSGLLAENREGGVYIDPTLLNKLRTSGKPNGISDLTKREFEIFIQSSAGKSDTKIAEDLSVELPYVKNVKSKINKKVKGSDVESLLSKLVENISPRSFYEEMVK